GQAPADPARSWRLGGLVNEILRVNPIACTGHGVCAELLPELIELDPWGYPIVPRAELSDDMLSLARRAVASCPVLALSVQKESHELGLGVGPRWGAGLPAGQTPPNRDGVGGVWNPPRGRGRGPGDQTPGLEPVFGAQEEREGPRRFAGRRDATAVRHQQG